MRVFLTAALTIHALIHLMGVAKAFHLAESGRPGRVPGTRELVIPRTPYVAAYALTRDCIRILRVLHGAQMWPDDLASD